MENKTEEIQEQEKDTGEETEKKPVSKLILLIVVVLIVGIVGGTLGTFIGNKLSDKPHAKQTEHISGKISEEQASIPLDEFLVNLSQDKNGEDSYIKIQLSLLVPAKVGEKEVEKNKDVIRDSVVNTLRKKEATSILEDTKGIETLKTDLKEEINQANSSSLVKEVFITNLVIQ
ncbi:flagellar basal body-associated FliL family protein [Vagococcus sp.]|uniref:flagellar basal body-associated FliL family protein n=1 Tax=Vagococcus sp. TaxID=1933889 RepID=UPI003F9B91AD